MALHRYAILTAWTTFLLLIAGALVTSTDSGLSVPDWPLSYGMWFPPMVGGILYEHSHRMLAAVVAIMIGILALWLWKAVPQRFIRTLGLAALALVIFQSLLGGLTVLLLLPPQISIAHAFFGQTVFCLLVFIASCTAPRWPETLAYNDRNRAALLKTLALWVAGVASVQVLLGAILRHTDLGLLAHLLGAAGLAYLIVLLARRVRQTQGAPIAWLVGARRLRILLVCQLILGGVTLAQSGHVLFHILHLGVGSMLLAQSVLLAGRLILVCTSRISVT